jgi:hypothetical protein
MRKWFEDNYGWLIPFVLFVLFGWVSLVNADIELDATILAASWKGKANPKSVWVDEDLGYVWFTETDEDLNLFVTKDGGDPNSNNWTDEGDVTTAGVTVDKWDIWYDQWTPGEASNKYVYIAYLSHDADEAYFHSWDLSDPNQTWTSRSEDKITNFASTSEVCAGIPASPGGSEIGLTQAESGRVYVMPFCNSSADGTDFCYSDNPDASDPNWSCGLTLPPVHTGSVVDFVYLLPADASDPNIAADDIYVLYWDRSSNEIDLYLYNSGGDNYPAAHRDEDIFDPTAMVENTATHTWGVSVRLSDEHVFIAAATSQTSGTLKTADCPLQSSPSCTVKTDAVAGVDLWGIDVTIDQSTDDIYVARGNHSTTVSANCSSNGGTAWQTPNNCNAGLSSTGLMDELVGGDDADAVFAGRSILSSGGTYQIVVMESTGSDLILTDSDSTNDGHEQFTPGAERRIFIVQ